MVHRDAQQQRLLAEIAGGATKLSAPRHSDGDGNERRVSATPDFDAEIRARLAARTSSALSAAVAAIDAHSHAIERVKQRLHGWREAPHADIRSLAHDIETLRERLSAAGVPGAEHDSWCERAKCPPRRNSASDRISARQRNVRSWEQRQLEAITALVSCVDSLEAVSERLRSTAVTKPGRLLGAVKSAQAAAVRAARSFEAPGLVHAAIELAPATATTDALLGSSSAAASTRAASSPTRREVATPPRPPPLPQVAGEASPAPAVDWRQKQRALAQQAAEQRMAAVASADSADRLIASVVADTAAAALRATCMCLEQGLDTYDALTQPCSRGRSDVGAAAETEFTVHVRTLSLPRPLSLSRCLSASLPLAPSVFSASVSLLCETNLPHARAADSH